MVLGVHFLLLIVPGHLLLMMLPTHRLLIMLRTHLLLVMLRLLIHRMGPVSSASGAPRLARVHFRLVFGHVPRVPLISGFRLVSICSSFFSVTSSGASVLPIMFCYISAVVLAFPVPAPAP